MDFQEAHLISVEDIIIISKLKEKNLFLCRFNPIVTMLVLDNYYDNEFASRKICRGANKHPFLHKNGSKVTEKDRKQERQIAVFSHMSK